MTMRCSYCGSHQHDIRTCPNTWAGSSRRANLRCTYCGGRDHDAQACRKRHTGRAEQDRGIRILDTWRR
ncbi:hypothetical protein [Paracoccus sp. (in: a-proteobacteria)]|uniref:hypothetical protein n=1 Tax=Paracoccus sp. TaxID=267 RepID=UPI0028A8447C|nr:hypothetical protein [Paracoccus sp. (in: a-proteobacteria)]